MKKCKKCGRISLFHKANNEQLCCFCAKQALSEESKIRDTALKRVRYVQFLSQSIIKNTDIITLLAEDELVNTLIANEIFELSNAFSSESKAVTDAVSFAPIYEMDSLISTSTIRLEDMHRRSLELLGDVLGTV